MPRQLDAEEIRRQLVELAGWRYDTGALRRTVEAPSFRVAITILDQIAEVAEEMNHHPDVDLRWRKLHIALTTHDADGVSQFDVELAHRINAVAADHGVVSDDAVDFKPDLELCIVCSDPDRLRPWWAAALRYVEHDGTLVDPDGDGPDMWFEQEESPVSGGNHVRLELTLPRHAAAARRDLLVARGGRLVAEQADHWELADPEGNVMRLVVAD